ncbi:FkbM family methyltransferase [Pontibacter chitinilyticus]|uniref:FkbM family methyltransferase n=1 Tax=Pontibacter chitinilyticus TaxID=2674989 RepID=UPI003219E1F9
MLNFILRAPLTLASLFREANQNKHFSVAEKAQAFSVLCKLFIKQRLRPQQTATVQVKLFGLRLQAYSYSALIFLFREIFLYESYYFEAETPAPLIIDGGANIGISALYFKYLYPRSTILAFEPNPTACALFRQNIHSNQLQNVTLVPIGLGKHRRELSFYTSEVKGSLIASFQKNSLLQEIKVPVEKLSEYIRRYTPELVKLDVEGAEIDIVQELKAAGVLAIPTQYLIEYHPAAQESATAFAAFKQVFQEGGFTYQIRNLDGSPKQDLLLHIYKSGEPTGPAST